MLTLYENEHTVAKPKTIDSNWAGSVEREDQTKAREILLQIDLRLASCYSDLAPNEKYVGDLLIMIKPYSLFFWSIQK